MASWILTLPGACLDANTTSTNFAALAMYLLTSVLMVTTHDGLLVEWLLCPRWPIWYRQRGPDARPDLVAARLTAIELGKDIVISPPLIVAMVCMTFALYAQHVLSMVLFVLHTGAAVVNVRYTSAFGLWRPRLFGLRSAIWRVRDLLHP
ncbi:hypothetical protein M409DRAFT_22684 [Zasmidium cellare ATCC 36951]|uniref:Uncharacterized protein n=1 Tax=Zasmidium cellare ATCC 36951 TaxID=1080233 RepID=A0A6A6CJ42_ZASCE|nr:uncharacterized protein M409DRAFT_22684 [Zasmidium cellare ATCC 36951]KAF2167257.1 hypothetical protein M409DRAFT_22684 [Zasmidium cellare ATCC 36951]